MKQSSANSTETNARISENMANNNPNETIL
jgi:hypothetical protein